MLRYHLVCISGLRQWELQGEIQSHIDMSCGARHIIGTQGLHADFIMAYIFWYQSSSGLDGWAEQEALLPLRWINITLILWKCLRGNMYDCHSNFHFKLKQHRSTWLWRHILESTNPKPKWNINIFWRALCVTCVVLSSPPSSPSDFPSFLSFLCQNDYAVIVRQEVTQKLTAKYQSVDCKGERCYGDLDHVPIARLPTKS